MMFSDVVMEIPKARFEKLLDEVKEEKGVKYDTELDADDLKGVVVLFKKLYRDEKGEFFPQDPRAVSYTHLEHMAVIEHQRARLGTRSGCVACKPNCSRQGYVPALSPLREFGVSKVNVCTYQAISGAGKTFKTWPEMVEDVYKRQAAGWPAACRTRWAKAKAAQTFSRWPGTAARS